MLRLCAKRIACGLSKCNRASLSQRLYSYLLLEITSQRKSSALLQIHLSSSFSSLEALELSEPLALVEGEMGCFALLD